jgi:hypothetical protein
MCHSRQHESAGKRHHKMSSSWRPFQILPIHLKNFSRGITDAL